MFWGAISPFFHGGIFFSRRVHLQNSLLYRLFTIFFVINIIWPEMLKRKTKNNFHHQSLRSDIEKGERKKYEMTKHFSGKMKRKSEKREENKAYYVITKSYSASMSRMLALYTLPGWK